MDYKGVIIEESLSSSEIVKELEVVDTEVFKITKRENTPWLDQWTLLTVVIPEGKMEEYANRLSKLIDKNYASSWYCDFENDNYHYVIFSEKIFKLDRTNKQSYQDMIEYGIKLGVPKEQLPTYNDLPTNLLIDFLLDAKRNTYANSTAKKESSSRLGSSDYHYEAETEGEKMVYHDTYFGGVKFMGEEVVYRGSDVPKWGMNYYGVTLDETLSEEAMDKALRPALVKVGEDDTVLPLRGPSYFQNDGYTYTFKTEGTIENFEGVEEIYKDEKLIYQLHCHGGIIE